MSERKLKEDEIDLMIEEIEDVIALSHSRDGFEVFGNTGHYKIKQVNGTILEVKLHKRSNVLKLVFGDSEE